MYQNQRIVTNHFNSGEWSPLMQNRIDLEKYGASAKKMYNFIPNPQGTALARQGTAFIGKCYHQDSLSALIPFQYSNEQSLIMEFSKNKLRFLNASGFLYDINQLVSAITNVDNQTQITVSDGTKFTVGKSISLSGVPEHYGFNNSLGKIISITGNNIITDLYFDSSFSNLTSLTDVNIMSIIEIDTPYDNPSILNNIRHAQKNDITYLFLDGYYPQKLLRYSNTNWELKPLELVDGPYLDTNSSTNNAYIKAAGGTPIINVSQTMNNGGTGTYNFDTATGTVLTGYQIRLPVNNPLTKDTTIYTNKDMEPTDFTLEGSNDGINYTVLDRQVTFIDYTNSISDYFTVKTTQEYIHYRLNITSIYNQSDIPPRIQDVIITTTTDADVNITFDNETNINNGDGFIATDVGRSIRIQREDITQIPVIITKVNNSTDINVKLVNYTFLNPFNTYKWRLGLICETVGYPSCGIMFNERLYMAGFENQPATIVASSVGAYENFQISNPKTGNISDSDSINVTLESRSKILWISSDDRGVILGTASGEFTLQGTNYGNPTSANIQSRNPTDRGSSNVDAVKIDHAAICVDKNFRSLRNMQYDFTIDGYKSTDISLQASHIGQPGIYRLSYCAQPNSIIYGLRNDGKLVAVTYIEDQQVCGFSLIEIPNCTIESIASIPSSDYQQDSLYMSCMRTINGKVVRTLERLLRYWDFNMTQNDCCMFDCAYVFTSKNKMLYGMQTLAGASVYGLIDGIDSIGPFIVGADGSLDISSYCPSIDSQVVIGLPYVCELITQNILSQSQIGQGLNVLKRNNKVVVNLWNTGNGYYGIPLDVNQPETTYLLPLEQQWGAFNYGYYYSQTGQDGNIYDNATTNNHKKGDPVTDLVYKTTDTFYVDYTNSEIGCIMPINNNGSSSATDPKSFLTLPVSPDDTEYPTVNQNLIYSYYSAATLDVMASFGSLPNAETIIDANNRKIFDALQSKPSLLVYPSVNQVYKLSGSLRFEYNALMCKLAGDNGNNIELYIPSYDKKTDSFFIRYYENNAITYSEEIPCIGISDDLFKDGFLKKFSGGNGALNWLKPGAIIEDYTAYDLTIPDDEIIDTDTNYDDNTGSMNSNFYKGLQYIPLNLYQMEHSDLATEARKGMGLLNIDYTDGVVSKNRQFANNIKDAVNGNSKLIAIDINRDSIVYNNTSDESERITRIFYLVNNSLANRIIISTELDQKTNTQAILIVSLLKENLKEIEYQERFTVENEYFLSSDDYSNIGDEVWGINGVIQPNSIAQNKLTGDYTEPALTYSRDISANISLKNVDPLISQSIELTIPPGYSRNGNLLFRKTIDQCLPFNISSISVYNGTENGE